MSSGCVVRKSGLHIRPIGRAAQVRMPGLFCDGRAADESRYQRVLGTTRRAAPRTSTVTRDAFRSVMRCRRAIAPVHALARCQRGASRDARRSERVEGNPERVEISQWPAWFDLKRTVEEQ